LASVNFNNRITGLDSQQTQSIRPKSTPQGDFAGALQAEVQKQSSVKLSAHAVQRLAERNVSLSESEQARLETAVDRIDGKGADKSLVLMDDLALLVSAKNRVVITAVDAASAKDGVFTNIDSAIII
jgi:flagellar operon protein